MPENLRQGEQARRSLSMEHRRAQVLASGPRRSPGADARAPDRRARSRSSRNDADTAQSRRNAPRDGLAPRWAGRINPPIMSVGGLPTHIGLASRFFVHHLCNRPARPDCTIPTRVLPWRMSGLLILIVCLSAQLFSRAIGAMGELCKVTTAYSNSGEATKRHVRAFSRCSSP
jgi:hypothetical protein